MKQKSNQEVSHFPSTALAHLIRLSSSTLLAWLWRLYSFLTITRESLNCEQGSAVAFTPVRCFPSSILQFKHSHYLLFTHWQVVSSKTCTTQPQSQVKRGKINSKKLHKWKDVFVRDKFFFHSFNVALTAAKLLFWAKAFLLENLLHFWTTFNKYIL